MTKRVLEGIHLVASSAFTSSGDCEAYLVATGGDSCVLIDAGCDPTASGLIANIEDLGTPVSYLILTHAHIDHIGGAHAVQERYGCRVVAHELERAGIENYDPVRTAADIYGVSYTPVRIDDIITGDATLRLDGKDFHFHHIPGHTPGSIAASTVIDNKKVLFAQDIHGPFHRNWGSDTTAWQESVEKLIALEADVLCEGHFGVYQPKERARRYLESFIKQKA